MKKRIVITVNCGVLAGVFTDGDPDDVIIEAIDYDDVKSDGSGILQLDAAEVEAEIKSGKLRKCW